MNKLFLAIFIDLENVGGIEFNLDALMNTLMLEDEQSQEHNESDNRYIFAIKVAYGAMDTISKRFKTQLTEHNFALHDTPHIGKKKNRADLFVSIDAFETLYLNSPPVDRYVFLTDDSDFTVISDKLRKYGKEVWLVCRKTDKVRKILAKACDRLLFLEDYQSKNQKTRKEHIITAGISDNDSIAIELFKDILKTIDLDKLPCNVSVISDKMKRIDPGFDIKRTTFKRFIKLAQRFKNQGIIKFQMEDTGFPLLEDIDLSKLD